MLRIDKFIIDFYCGAGGAALGFAQAGFKVVGVDKKPMPRYPYPFILGDAIDVLTRMLAGLKFPATDGNIYGLDDFDAIHASPPCQRYSKITGMNGNRDKHPDLLQPTIDLLEKSGKPYSVENVEGAPMTNYVMLCGTMFGLKVFRHRLFVTKPQILMSPMACNHNGRSINGGRNGQQKHAGAKFITVTGSVSPIAMAENAMGIHWMNRRELVQAIPPAYTKFIGEHLMRSLENE